MICGKEETMKKDLEDILKALKADQTMLMDELSDVERDQEGLARRLEAAKAVVVGSMIQDLSNETIVRLRQRWPMFPLPVTRPWLIGPLRFKPGVTLALLQIQFRHFIDQRLERGRDESLAPLRLMEEKLAKYAGRVRQLRFDAEGLQQRLGALEKLLATDLAALSSVQVNRLRTEVESSARALRSNQRWHHPTGGGNSSDTSFDFLTTWLMLNWLFDDNLFDVGPVHHEEVTFPALPPSSYADDASAQHTEAALAEADARGAEHFS